MEMQSTHIPPDEERLSENARRLLAVHDEEKLSEKARRLLAAHDRAVESADSS